MLISKSSIAIKILVLDVKANSHPSSGRIWCAEEAFPNKRFTFEQKHFLPPTNAPTNLITRLSCFEFISFGNKIWFVVKCTMTHRRAPDRWSEWSCGRCTTTVLPLNKCNILLIFSLNRSATSKTTHIGRTSTVHKYMKKRF